jgi:large subunit ribosomal protein L9
MKVVLLVDVKKLGQRGSVVTVADGYAMNVLIPQKKAVPATDANIQKAEKAALAAEGKKEMDAALAKKALAEIDGKTFTISAKTNDTGGLFEAIRQKQIAVHSTFPLFCKI